MKKTRVLIFTNCFKIGGSERQAVELVKRLDQSRFELMLACFRKEGPLIEDLAGHLDEVHAFPLTGFRNVTALRQAAGFIGFLRRARVQVVQSFDFYANLFAVPLARLAGVPVIIASRRDEGVMRTGAQQRTERWCYALVNGIVANAQAIKDQLVLRDGLRSEKIWVIPNGLDLDHFDRCLGQAEPAHKNGEITISVVANLRPEKGHLVFLEATQRLVNRYPQARFLVVGDGPMRQKVEVRVKELGLSDRVRMTGMVNRVPDLLKSVDIAVLPSLKNEGLPNAVMEAMAASIPVVATDTGGTGELVIDGLTGYLVPPGDGTALADRIGRLCGEPDTRRKMGAAGRRHVVEQFTAEPMARRFEQLYEHLVNKHCSAGQRP